MSSNIESKDKTDTTTTGSNTLAHELVAREEQNVGIFLASFAIQFYLHKDLLKYKLNKPTFLIYFGDVEIFASQRVMIKSIISNPKYKEFCQEIENILLEHNDNLDQQPQEILFADMRKSFLIRQIFKQTDQVLPKYNFIEKFIDLPISELNFDNLAKEMTHLPVEEQVLVMVRIFNHMKDTFESKKKSIISSFIENIKRTKDDYQYKNKYTGQEAINIDMFFNEFKE